MSDRRLPKNVDLDLLGHFSVTKKSFDHVTQRSTRAPHLHEYDPDRFQNQTVADVSAESLERIEDDGMHDMCIGEAGLYQRLSQITSEVSPALDASLDELSLTQAEVLRGMPNVVSRFQAVIRERLHHVKHTPCDGCLSQLRQVVRSHRPSVALLALPELSGEAQWLTQPGNVIEAKPWRDQTVPVPNQTKDFEHRDQARERVTHPIDFQALAKELWSLETDVNAFLRAAPALARQGIIESARQVLVSRFVQTVAPVVAYIEKKGNSHDLDNLTSILDKRSDVKALADSADSPVAVLLRRIDDLGTVAKQSN